MEEAFFAWFNETPVFDPLREIVDVPELDARKAVAFLIPYGK